MNKHAISILVMCFLVSLPTKAQTTTDSVNLQTLALAALNHNHGLQNSDLDIKKNEQIKKSIHHVYIPTLEAKGSYAYSAGQFNLNNFQLPFRELPYPLLFRGFRLYKFHRLPPQCHL